VDVIMPGDTIYYHLRPRDLPVNPLKLWNGCVAQVYQGQSGRIYAYAVVCSEYQDDGSELVILSQVVLTIPRTRNR